MNEYYTLTVLTKFEDHHEYSEYPLDSTYPTFSEAEEAGKKLRMFNPHTIKFRVNVVQTKTVSDWIDTDPRKKYIVVDNKVYLD